jgi:phosphoenolpyruvate-protein kinase (PTS system EI component)
VLTNLAKRFQSKVRLQRGVDEANAKSVVSIMGLEVSLHAKADPAKAAIFAAHQELLQDPDLMDIADSAIAKGKSAAFAWQRAYTTHAERLAGLKNEVMAGRAADLRDVGRRVLGIFTGQPVQEPEIPQGAILIAEDLTPSDTAKLDPAQVFGFATVGGGATSHVAILARSLDIPAVAGVEPRALDLDNGQDMILDGGKGQVRINPDPAEIDRIRSTLPPTFGAHQHRHRPPAERPRPVDAAGHGGLGAVQDRGRLTLPGDAQCQRRR